MILPHRFRFIALLLCLLSSLAAAQVDSRPYAEAERAQRAERARVLNSEAAAEQKAADATLKAENEACYKKFQVSSCLEDAKKKHIAATREAQRKELEAGRLQLVLPGWQAPVLPVYAVTPRRDVLPAKVGTVQNFV